MTKNRTSKIIWFTGMSGAGKSFYADHVNKILQKENLKVNVIDGDVIRDKYKIPMGFNFDEICREKNVEYVACAGTLLGAIRHGKIIPWDDDLDIIIDIDNIEMTNNRCR